MDSNRVANGSQLNSAAPKKIGHRYQKGHPKYPPKLIGGKRKVSLSTLQRRRKEHVAALSDLMEELEARRKAGEKNDPALVAYAMTFATLINTQGREMKELTG